MFDGGAAPRDVSQLQLPLLGCVDRDASDAWQVCGADGQPSSAAPRVAADGDRAPPENTWVVCASPHGRPSAVSIAASPTKQLVLWALRTSEKPISVAEVSATIGISNDATLAAVGLEGHQ